MKQTLGISCEVKTHELSEGPQCGAWIIRGEKAEGASDSAPSLCLLKGNRLGDKLSIARVKHWLIAFQLTAAFRGPGLTDGVIPDPSHAFSLPLSPLQGLYPGGQLRNGIS